MKKLTAAILALTLTSSAAFAQSSAWAMQSSACSFPWLPGCAPAKKPKQSFDPYISKPYSSEELVVNKPVFDVVVATVVATVVAIVLGNGNSTTTSTTTTNID